MCVILRIVEPQAQISDPIARELPLLLRENSIVDITMINIEVVYGYRRNLIVALEGANISVDLSP